MVGLPLHLCTREILKKVGDNSGGFVAMDKGTTLRTDLRWARILVKRNGMGKPSFVNLLAGARSYELQIGWEIQPRVAEVYPRRNIAARVLVEPKEEDTRCWMRECQERRNDSRSSRKAERREPVGAFEKTWVSKQLVPASKLRWDPQRGAHALF